MEGLSATAPASHPDCDHQTPRTLEEVASIVVDTAFHLYDELGPGLLESVYQSVLASMLERRGLRVERQKLVVFDFDGVEFNEGLRVDLLVEGCLVVELKSLEVIAPVHLKQLLTYLRLMKLPLGLLINFGGANFKGAVRRVVNNRVGFVSEFRPTRGEAAIKAGLLVDEQGSSTT